MENNLAFWFLKKRYLQFQRVAIVPLQENTELLLVEVQPSPAQAPVYSAPAILELGP